MTFFDLYLILLKGCGVVAAVLITLGAIFAIGMTIYGSFKSWIDSNWP